MSSSLLLLLLQLTTTIFVSFLLMLAGVNEIEDVAVRVTSTMQLPVIATALGVVRVQ